MVKGVVPLFVMLMPTSWSEKSPVLVTVDENDAKSPGTSGAVCVVVSVAPSWGNVWMKGGSSRIVSDGQVDAPGTQLPAWQLSPLVQLLPSSQALPSDFVGFVQVPVPELHVPTEWHWSWATQVTALPVQTPTWQLSASVQALPSLQSVPFVAFGFEQTPVAGAQVPMMWH